MARPKSIEIDPEGSFRDAARRTIAVRGPELMVHKEGTLLGDDIEELHSMRVASRRLRAALEVYAGCFPPRRHKQLLALVKDSADALSEARDMDVIIDFLTTHADGAPAADRPGIESLVAVLRGRRAAADEHLAPALQRLDDERFLEQVERLLK